ncbi:MAG: DNA recombination protein RmuC [Bacteroidota bacterium]|nr:DNA recombination protein RmuC [Bacteroidota bacterium]
MFSYFFYFITGIIFTAIVAWFLYRSVLKTRLASLMEKLQEQINAKNQLQQQVQQLQKEKDILIAKAVKAEFLNDSLNEKNSAFDQLQKQYQFVQNQFSATKESLKNNEEKLALQKEELSKIGESFKFEFRNLAQNILEEKTQRFTEVNEEKMKAILDPLKKDLGIFKSRVEETYDKESKERFSLGKEIENLIKMTQQVSADANNLTTALKGNNKMQGNWGEMILESLLENSGLAKGREYFLQEFIRDNAGNIVKDEHGAGLQPDVIICYPDQRKIIIDSKVSMIAWDECIAHETPQDQLRCLHQHIKSIRLHIDGLSKKNYPKYALALDYVLLFIPIEPAFLEAVKTDLQLWKYAYDRKILLVSPTNLFAVLKIIADLWKVEQQNKNAIEIAHKAGSLYDKFASFLDNFESVGRKLNEANSNYEMALKQLTTGRGNVIGKIEELKKMGANAVKQIPERLLL